MNTLFIKAIRDLLTKKVQSFIIILALSLGVIGVGAIFNVYTILKREMQKNYDMTNPPHFIINFDSLPPGLGNKLQELESSYEWEYRGIIEGRVLSGDGTWKTLILEVVPDFSTRKIDRFFGVSSGTGQKDKCPTIGTIFLEKAALPVAKKSVGEQLTLIIPGSSENKLKVTGLYHAPSLPPAWMENWVYGYISEETAVKLIGNNGVNQLLVRSRNTILTTAQAQNEVSMVKDRFAESGINVKSVTVPIPGAHPHAGQMNSLLYMMQVFGVIALILAAALVGNIFGSLIVRQKREIGIMKALGAVSAQILSINLIQIGILSSIALLVAIPIGQLFAQKYSAFSATILNFKIYDTTVPWWGYAFQIIVGLGIPLLSALLQIRGAIKVTVREIMTDYGVRSVGRSSLFTRLQLRPGMTPLVLSLRNAFRNKGRMAMLVISLSAGGILFMMSQNISQSIVVTVEKLFTSYNYDASFTFTKASSTDAVQFFSNQKEVVQYEIWSTRHCMLNGRETEIYALPASTTMMNIMIGAESAIVTHTFANFYKKKIGDQVEIVTPAGPVTRKIQSVMTIFGTPAIYITQESLSDQEKTLFDMFVVVKYQNAGLKTSPGSNHLQLIHEMLKGKKQEQRANVSASDLTTTIENALNCQNAGVIDSRNKQEQKESMISHMKLIASFLTMMSFLSLIIGALTIISSVSLSVLERRREIGVLRAFGTQGTSIIRLFTSENVFIGFISFLLSMIAAFPLSIIAGNVFGQIFLNVSLTPSVSHHGIGVWLIISLFLAMAFSYLSAVKASDGELHELLSYE
jgi:putative ABC transport system permease protein